MNIQFPPWTLGSFIALIILIIVLILLVIGKMPPFYAGLFIGLAAARLL